MTVDELAGAIGGRVEGDGSPIVTGIAALDEAGPGDVTFLANARYAAAAARSRAGAVIVDEKWDGECPGVRVRVANPDLAFARAATLLGPPEPEPEPGVHPSAVVAEDVRLGEGVSVGPLCAIESGVRIGDGTRIGSGVYVGRDSAIGAGCRIYPNVSIRERATIGDRVIVHCGAVIGSDGFGYVMTEGHWEKIPQVGVVILEDDVEIGACATIDRARFGKTVIGRGVKIDNLVQIAHNVKIGAHTALAAQVGVAGSTTVGAYVQMGGQAGVVGHIAIGDQVGVAGRAGVTKDVASGQFVSGFPAIPHAEAMKIQAQMNRLPALKKRVAELERRLAELEKKPEASG